MLEKNIMKKQLKISGICAVVLIAAALVAACGDNAPQPTLVPTLSLPTAQQEAPAQQGAPAKEPDSGLTPAPDSNTSATALPEAGSLPIPQGTPASDWKGLPVMPGAVAGQGDDQGYFYSTKSSLEEIRAYYEEELPAQGWVLLAANEGRANSVMLFFEKGDESANIAIIDNQRQDGLVIVLLIKD